MLAIYWKWSQYCLRVCCLHIRRYTTQDSVQTSKTQMICGNLHKLNSTATDCLCRFISWIMGLLSAVGRDTVVLVDLPLDAACPTIFKLFTCCHHLEGKPLALALLSQFSGASVFLARLGSPHAHTRPLTRLLDTEQNNTTTHTPPTPTTHLIIFAILVLLALWERGVTGLRAEP